MKPTGVHFILAVALTAGAAFGQASSSTDLAKDGFAGPVKSVSTTQVKTQVNFRQPSGPALIMPIFCYECAYDRDGAKTSHGAIINGRFTGDLYQIQRDASGRAIARNLIDTDTNEVVIREVLGPHGVVEHTYFVKGKVDSRETSSYDQNGQLASRESFDEKGELTVSALTHYNKEGVLLEATERYGDGATMTHYVFDPAANVEISTRFDPSGRVMIEWKMVDNKLVHFWRDPNLGSNIRIPGERFTNKLGNGNFDHYSCDSDSKCTIVHLHFDFAGDSKTDPVSAEWRDTEGNLLYAAYTTYTFDVYRNWTRREVRVWTPELGKRALYETDARKFEYWQ